MSRHTLTFFFLRISSYSAKPPPVAILPSALLVSDIRSVLGGCSRFSRCCYLISVLCSHLCGESWAPGVRRSHLDSAVGLGCPDRNSKPPRASPYDYCGRVRTPRTRRSAQVSAPIGRLAFPGKVAAMGAARRFTNLKERAQAGLPILQTKNGGPRAIARDPPVL